MQKLQWIFQKFHKKHGLKKVKINNIFTAFSIYKKNFSTERNGCVS